MARWQQIDRAVGQWEHTVAEPAIALPDRSADGLIPLQVSPLLTDGQFQMDGIRSIFEEAIGIEQVCTRSR